MTRFARFLSLVLALVLCAGICTCSFAEEEVKVLRYVTPGNDWSDQDYVMGLVNDKLKADGLNIEVQLVRIPWDVWDQKTNLMFATGEEFEMIHVMQDVKSATVLRSMGAIQPINDYLDKYPALVETLKERWPEFTVEGDIMAVPVKPNYYISRDYGRIFYRQDIFEKAGGVAPTTVDEVIDLALKMQEILLEETGMTCYTWTHALNRPFTWLHRTYEDAPFVVENTLGIAKFLMDGTVESYYESDTFKKDAEVYKKMYDLGLVNPDILTLDNDARANAGNYGQFIFGFETHDYQSEATLIRNTGSEMGDFWLNPEMGNVLYFGIYNGNAIPASCTDPDVPLSFMNWLYTSEENFQLFVYGERGRDYDIDENGRLVTYYDESGNPKYQYDTWQIGNADYQLLDAQLTDKYVKMCTEPIEGRKVRTPVVGFNFDTTNVANEIANLENEIITSIYPIKFGLVDYDSNIEQALANLKAAGLDKVMEEYRRQYAAHYEANKDLVGIFED